MQKLDQAFKLIGIWGYPGLFLGLVAEFLGFPFPGEIVLTYTGYLVYIGILKFETALFSAVAGSLTGTIIAYSLGRKFGRPLLDKYGRYIWLNRKKLDKAEDWFNKHGILVLLFGRFVPGIRPLSAYSAGFAKMKLALFLPLSLAGAFLWCLTFITAGKLLGLHWQRIALLMARYNLVIMGFAGVVILAYVFSKIFRTKKSV